MAQVPNADGVEHSRLSTALLVTFMVMLVLTVVFVVVTALQYFAVVDIAPVRTLGLETFVLFILTLIAFLVMGMSASYDERKQRG